MELINIAILCYAAALFCLTRGLEYGGTSPIINVVDYGAVGDGETDDSQAFEEAWDDVCKAKGDMPTLLVPRNKTFLLKPIQFKGYCSPVTINFQVLGNIVAPGPHQIKWKNIVNSANCWIAFSYIRGLIINGTGEIDGRGSQWWNDIMHLHDAADLDTPENKKRPTALHFYHCYDCEVNGLRFVNPPKNHISINNCARMNVSQVSIYAPELSPNTDGIDISESTRIQIHNSTIGTGDDCIAINGNSSYVNITGLTCGPGHGISVGSLGSRIGVYDTVEEIYVYNCTFNRTTNGARIKTWQGGSGYARKITFEQIALFEAANPIIINQYYCTSRKECKNQTSAVEVSEITYKEVKGSCIKKKAIDLRCSQSKACTNILMDEVEIYSSKDTDKAFAFCYNAQGKANSTVPDVPCLSYY